MEYNEGLKAAFLNEIITQADAGTGNAYITIRSGSREAIDETNFYYEQVLATFPLNKPCAVYDGVDSWPRIVFDLASTEAILERSGTASVWRLHNSDGTTIVMGNVSEIEGKGEIRFSTLVWEADGTSKAIMSFASLVING